MRERREEERKIVREGEATSPSCNEERRRRAREERRGKKNLPLLLLRTRACRRARGRGDVTRETVEIGGENKEERERERERERENEEGCGQNVAARWGTESQNHPPQREC